MSGEDASQRALRTLTGMMYVAGRRDHANRLYHRGEVIALDRAQQQLEAAATNGSPRRTAGPSKPTTGAAGRVATSPGLTAMVNLAEMQAARGNYAEAVRLHRRVIQAEEHAVGVDSPLLVPRLHALAAVLDDAGDRHEALCVRDRILKLQQPYEAV